MIRFAIAGSPLDPSLRRSMLLRAFVAQNCAVGCAYGGFGVSILPLQDRFDASRASVSVGLSLVVLMTALSGPLVAILAKRFGLRSIMIAGALACCAGYALLSVAWSMTVVLAAFALLVGPGVGLSGTLPASLLASGWFPEARGRAIGLSTMPVVIAAAPMAGLALIQTFGLSGLYLAMAGLHLLTVPLLLGVREAPVAPIAVDPGQQARGERTGGLLSSPLFWFTMVGAGLLNATGIVGSVHMVAVSVERGLPIAQAALLASLMGGASVLGAVAIGWLCDHLGGARSLAVVAGGFALGWTIIGLTGWLPAMTLAILLVGASGPGVFPCVSLLFARSFGPVAMARAVALFGMFSVPFTFFLPPAAGWLRDLAGDYRPVMGTIVCICLTVAMLFALMARREERNGREQLEVLGAVGR
jgi:Cyanate permease